MYGSVLVPLDGTWFGEHALPLARGIARRFGAALHLVHVHKDAVMPTAVESLPYLGVNLPSARLDTERAYLDDLAAILSKDGIRVTTDLVQGALPESLERYAIDRGADLVVACTHCHEGLSRFWHRGVSKRLLQDISIPILLIRTDDTEPNLTQERSFQHILIPLNGSQFAEQILDKAIPLGRGLGARFTLLRVVRPMMMAGYTLLGQDVHINEFLLEEQEQEARAYLNRVAERLRAAGLDVSTRVVADDDPAQAIVESTRPDLEPGLPPVDLIAMTTHSRGLLSRFVLSSITESVLHQSPVPLLLHHPQMAEEEAYAGSAIHAMPAQHHA
jgi:nucleotide-binding universal stress UspA family protein